jgi:hypothetical protein
MPENGYFHQNKAISAVIQAVLSCPCMPQIRKSVIVETPIPKAKRSGIGKLNNPVKRRV